MQKTALHSLIFLVIVMMCGPAGGFPQWSDNMEYSSQAALEAQWPAGFVGPGASALTLTTEVSHSPGKSAKCSVDAQMSTHLFTEQLPAGGIEIWMYDAHSADPNAWLWAEVGINDSHWAMVGVLGPQYGDIYVYRFSGSGYATSGIARSQGWHKILITFGDPELGGSIYLDDVHLADSTMLAEGCRRIRLGVDWQGVGNQEVFYFDDLSYVFEQDPLVDDAQTVALWHMDNTVVIDPNTFIPDDDTNNPGRNQDLNIDDNGNPTLTTGNGGVWGEALRFTGNSMAVVPGNAWLGQTQNLETVQVDFWVKPTAFTISGTVVGVPGVWEVNLDGRAFLTVWDVNGEPAVLMGEGLETGYWYHIIATYFSGDMTLIVNGQKRTGSGPLWKKMDAPISVGNRLGGSNYFAGYIDEVKISLPALSCGDWGYSDADLDQDCYVNVEDYALFSLDWLACTDPNDPVNCTMR